MKDFIDTSNLSDCDLEKVNKLIEAYVNNKKGLIFMNLQSIEKVNNIFYAKDRNDMLAIEKDGELVDLFICSTCNKEFTLKEADDNSENMGCCLEHLYNLEFDDLNEFLAKRALEIAFINKKGFSGAFDEFKLIDSKDPSALVPMDFMSDKEFTGKFLEYFFENSFHTDFGEVV